MTTSSTAIGVGGGGVSMSRRSKRLFVLCHLDFDPLGQPLCRGVWAAGSVSALTRTLTMMSSVMPHRRWPSPILLLVHVGMVGKGVPSGGSIPSGPRLHSALDVSAGTQEGVHLAGLLRQPIAAQELRPAPEPRLARPEHHRVRPPGAGRQGLRRALHGQDCRDEDRLRESPTRARLACTSLTNRGTQAALWQCYSACSLGASQPAPACCFSACARVHPCVVKCAHPPAASYIQWCCCANDGTHQRLRESVPSVANTGHGRLRTARGDYLDIGGSTGGGSRRIIDSWQPPDWHAFLADEQES